MKAFNILIKLAAIAALSLALVACESDPCKDSEERCLNGATCLDGTCVCADGYEGDSCSVVSRNKFLGTGGTQAVYGASDACTGGSTFNYDMTFSASGTGTDKILIQNFLGYECNGSPISVVATVDGDKFTVNETAKPCITGLTLTITATGTYSASGVTMSYTLVETNASGSATSTCTSTLTKK